MFKLTLSVSLNVMRVKEQCRSR